MKKNIILLPLFAACFALADDEVYDNKTIFEDFSGKSMNYSSWQNASAIGSKFIGTKLKEAVFTNAQVYCDFSNATLSNAVFDGATVVSSDYAMVLSNSILEGASFRNVEFAKLTWTGKRGSAYKKVAVDFSNLNLSNVDFTGSTFCYASKSSNTGVASNFTGTILKNTNFTSAILSIGGISVDFSNLDLSTCIFDKAILSNYFNQTYAYTSSVIFSNSKLSGASFKEAILASYSAVDFSNLDLNKCDFSNAILSNYKEAEDDWNGEKYGSVNMSGASLKNAKFDGAIISASEKSGVNFSNADLTGASFKNAQFKSGSANFENAIITNVDFSNAIGLTTSQLSQTLNYQNKDLSGIKFNGLDLTNWLLRGRNLQNTSFVGANLTGVNARYADLRGADLTGITGSLKTQNTIWTDGEIKNFSMESVDDSLTIRAYVPATSGGEMINAKIAEDATISGGAVLTLEEGAILEIMAGKTLTVADNSEIIFNVDVASNNTKILLDSGSTLAFGADSKVTINLDGVISPDDSYTFSVIEAAADACISGADAISKDNLVLNVNGEAYDSDKWGFNFDPTTGALTINVNVPEPATVTAIFGAVALAFAVYRRRK